MTRRTGQIWISLGAGLAISGLLLWLSYATRSSALYLPQFAGFLACMLLRGVHSATKADYLLIALPTNAIVYAALIFALLRGFLGRRKR
jgi:hypothetical protein